MPGGLMSGGLMSSGLMSGELMLGGLMSSGLMSGGLDYLQSSLWGCLIFIRTLANVCLSCEFKLWCLYFG